MCKRDHQRLRWARRAFRSIGHRARTCSHQMDFTGPAAARGRSRPVSSSHLDACWQARCSCFGSNAEPAVAPGAAYLSRQRLRSWLRSCRSSLWSSIPDDGLLTVAGGGPAVAHGAGARASGPADAGGSQVESPRLLNSARPIGCSSAIFGASSPTPKRSPTSTITCGDRHSGRDRVAPFDSITRDRP